MVMETHRVISQGSLAERPVRRWHLFTWSLISVIGSMMLIPLNALIPAFYAKNTATGLATIGFVLLIARLYDAVADPVVGYLSDQTKSPIGRRKPWILAGGALGCVAAYLLFNPAPTADGSYFLPVILLFYTAFTMLTVPHSAWGSELSRVSAERTTISGVLTFAGVAGLLIFMGLPILLSSPLLPLFPTAEVTPPMLRILGWLILILTPVCVLISVVFTPKGAAVIEERVSFKDMIGAIRANKPFWAFMAAYSMTGLAYGVYYATTYMFLDAYLGLGDKFPLIYAVAAIAQMVSIPLWTKLSQRFERNRIWAIGIATFGILLTLRVFIPRGEAGLPLVLILSAVASFANAASQVPQMAVLADCIDYDTLRTRTNRAGTYYAVQQFVLKATLAAGGGLAFLALSVFKYDAKAEVHTAESLRDLAVVHTYGPLVLFCAAGLLLWFFPLNRRRQATIRRRIETRLPIPVAPEGV